jgi:predicted secreted Zn-dependent protease
VDARNLPIKQSLGHRHSIGDADPELDMQLTYERKPDQCLVRNAPRSTSASRKNVSDVVLRKEIVCPLWRRLDRK